MEKWLEMFTNKVSVKESVLCQRRSSHHQNVNYPGACLGRPGRAQSLFSPYKSGTCAAEHTAALHSPECFSLTPFLFFCSLAAARRREQLEQTGFLSLAVIHLDKSRSYPINIFVLPSHSMFIFVQSFAVRSAVIMWFHMPPIL